MDTARLVAFASTLEKTIPKFDRGSWAGPDICTRRTIRDRPKSTPCRMVILKWRAAWARFAFHRQDLKLGKSVSLEPALLRIALRKTIFSSRESFFAEALYACSKTHR